MHARACVVRVGQCVRAWCAHRLVGGRLARTLGDASMHCQGSERMPTEPRGPARMQGGRALPSRGSLPHRRRTARGRGARCRARQVPISRQPGQRARARATDRGTRHGQHTPARAGEEGGHRRAPRHAARRARRARAGGRAQTGRGGRTHSSRVMVSGRPWSSNGCSGKAAASCPRPTRGLGGLCGLWGARGVPDILHPPALFRLNRLREKTVP